MRTVTTIRPDDSGGYVLRLGTILRWFGGIFGVFVGAGILAVIGLAWSNQERLRAVEVQVQTVLRNQEATTLIWNEHLAWSRDVLPRLAMREDVNELRMRLSALERGTAK